MGQALKRVKIWVKKILFRHSQLGVLFTGRRKSRSLWYGDLT
jgi:hypothetical protein